MFISYNKWVGVGFNGPGTDIFYFEKNTSSFFWGVFFSLSVIDAHETDAHENILMKYKGLQYVLYDNCLNI